jgi:hypothetical protein
MRTLKCDKHNNLIVVLEPREEAIFSSKLDATVVFYDARGKPYLKRYVRGRCDENCSVVGRLLTSLDPETISLEMAIGTG